MQNRTLNFSLIAAASLIIVTVYALENSQIRSYLHKQPQTVAAINYRSSVDRSHYLFDYQGTISSPLLSLLRLTDIEHDNSLASIVEKTQKQWLRAAGKERWEIDELYPEKRTEALALLDSLGCIAEVRPAHTHYDYAIVLGATVQRVRMRLQYLINLHSNGVQFKKIIILGGERPLDATLERKDVLLDTNNGLLTCKTNWKLQGPLPITEIEMMKMVYDQTQLPEKFAKIPVTFIDTPMIKMENGAVRRPGFGDTIQTWLSHNPKEGSCLFISNNPYVGYADSVVRTFMPNRFIVETVGSAASDETKLSVHLDNCARWLYQEKIRAEKE